MNHFKMWKIHFFIYNSFGGTEMQKHKFHYSKCPVDINKVDLYKSLISNKVSFGAIGFKYLLCFQNNTKICFEKLESMQNIFMKLNKCLFWLKIMNC